jgi:hypothetical protein
VAGENRFNFEGGDTHESGVNFLHATQKYFFKKIKTAIFPILKLATE